MRSLNISLPESMRTFVDDQTKRGGYGTASEFLRTLIRDAQKRQAEDRLEAMLMEGLDSGKPIAPKFQEAQRRMAPQLVAHVLMVGLIVVGNVIYFAGRRKGAHV